MIANGLGAPRPGWLGEDGGVRRPNALVLALALALAVGACDRSPVDAEGLPTGTLSIDGQDGRATFDVQIAETPSARQQGLMGVEDLPEGEGMVFVFDDPTHAAFWMKETLIPLSIAFWGGDGRIVAMLDMEPCRSDPCPLYSPGADYLYAVEVNRGALAAAGVAVGDEVSLSRPTPATGP
jgi:uncharacterized membrane protein (UPF0127 family)